VVFNGITPSVLHLLPAIPEGEQLKLLHEFKEKHPMANKPMGTPPTSRNPELDKLTPQLATAMAPMLLAVAIFSLTLLRQTTDPTGTRTDEIFAFLSGICLLGSATSADAVMDSCEATTPQRLKFLRIGYPLFCLAVAILTAAVPILYAETQRRSLSWWMYLLFFATGCIVGWKPMVKDEPVEEYSLTWAMGFASALTIATLTLLTHPGRLRGHLGF
jgi:hypothetical protein